MGMSDFSDIRQLDDRGAASFDSGNQMLENTIEELRKWHRLRSVDLWA